MIYVARFMQSAAYKEKQSRQIQVKQQQQQNSAWTPQFHFIFASEHTVTTSWSKQRDCECHSLCVKLSVVKQLYNHLLHNSHQADASVRLQGWKADKGMHCWRVLWFGRY